MSSGGSITEAIRRFNAENATDPRRAIENGEEKPYELLQAERLESWVLELEPNASEALRLAARCQHLLRFRCPRNSYPMDRIGYLKWRKDLARFHADQAEIIMTEVGIDPAVRAQVRKIQLKQELKRDVEAQTMEDALCLAFLEHELSDFASAHADDKVIDIIRKTWRKMSTRGHDEALSLPLSGRALALVQEALAVPPEERQDA